MITIIVQFPMPGATSETAAELFRQTAPNYQGLRGLIRKYYIFGEGTGGGVYLWQSRAEAMAFYTPEWRRKIADRYGAEPSLSIFESPVIVENSSPAA